MTPRLLWVSECPHRSTGFGLVTREICLRLASAGFKVRILGWWTSATTKHLDSIEVYTCPTRPDLAVECIEKHILEFQPQLLITYCDAPWVSYLITPAFHSLRKSTGTRWLFYCPIDGVLATGGLPKAWVETLRHADARVVTSQFGARGMLVSGLEALVIPHGCDTSLFKPPTDRRTAKATYGYENAFVVLSDMRNHRRKLLPRLLDICRMVCLKRPNILFHLHTNLRPVEDLDSYAYDVEADARLLGISSNIRIGSNSGSPLTLPELASIYALADLHLITSFGEGFSLPTLQAASSGVVPLAPAHSAVNELLGTHGVPIPIEATTTDEFGIVRSFISRTAAADAIIYLHDNERLLQDRSRNARAFAVLYSWSRVIKNWVDVINHVLDFQIAPSPSPSDCREEHWPDHRPSGHDASVLPRPRLSIPVVVDKAISSSVGFKVRVVVLAEGRSSQLDMLVDAFLVVEVLYFDSANISRFLRSFYDERTILVIDQQGLLGEELDYLCAARSISYFGPNARPSAAPENYLVDFCRRILTDYPFAEMRIRAAQATTATLNLRAAMPPDLDHGSGCSGTTLSTWDHEVG